MTEKTKRNGGKGRKDKSMMAFEASGLDRTTFDLIWERIPDSVKRKCSSKELAAMTLLAGKVPLRGHLLKPLKQIIGTSRDTITAKHRFKGHFPSLKEASSWLPFLGQGELVWGLSGAFWSVFRGKK